MLGRFTSVTHGAFDNAPHYAVVMAVTLGSGWPMTREPPSPPAVSGVRPSTYGWNRPTSGRSSTPVRDWS